MAELIWIQVWGANLSPSTPGIEYGRVEVDPGVGCQHQHCKLDVKLQSFGVFLFLKIGALVYFGGELPGFSDFYRAYVHLSLSSTSCVFLCSLSDHPVFMHSPAVSLCLVLHLSGLPGFFHSSVFYFLPPSLSSHQS